MHVHYEMLITVNHFKFYQYLVPVFSAGYKPVLVIGEFFLTVKASRM